MLNELPGAIAVMLLAGCGLRVPMPICGDGDDACCGGGVLHENLGASLCVRGFVGCEKPAERGGLVVREFVPHPPSKASIGPLVRNLPVTRLSKSSSPPFWLPPSPFVALPGPLPKDMKSLALVPPEGALLMESSWSLRVCSCSMRVDSCLISVMKAWNCCKLRSGPSEKFHSIGKTSMARKSESAIFPTSWKTSRAAT